MILSTRKPVKLPNTILKSALGLNSLWTSHANITSEILVSTDSGNGFLHDGAHCYFLSCYFFSSLPSVSFFPIYLFILLSKWTVIFFPVSFFPTCPLLLSFLLLFFLLVHCYFLSCYFFSVTFFPVTFFPTIGLDFLLSKGGGGGDNIKLGELGSQRISTSDNVSALSWTAPPWFFIHCGSSVNYKSLIYI